MLVSTKTPKRETFVSRGEMTKQRFSLRPRRTLYTHKHPALSFSLLFTDEELGLECDGGGGEGVR